MRQIPRGFTLVEIAIAIFIIMLLLGSILVPLTTQVEQRQVSETQKMLEDVKEALIGHAIAKGYLPCADKTSGANNPPNDAPNDGVEDYITGTGVCISNFGNIPWATLGLGAMDPWGNRFRYRVHSDFAQRTGTTCTPAPCPPLFGLTTTPNLTVTATMSGALLTPTDGVVAVILSHGKNGFGAMNSQTNTARPAPCSADELDNSGGGASYTSRTIFYSNIPCPNTDFDDIVIWLTKYTLLNRMVAAGKLP